MWPQNTPFTKHEVPGHEGVYFFTDNAGKLVRIPDVPPRWLERNRRGDIQGLGQPYIQINDVSSWGEDFAGLALETIAAAAKGWTGASIAFGVVGIAEAAGAAAAAAAAEAAAAEAAAAAAAEAAAKAAVEEIAEETVWDWIGTTVGDAVDTVSNWFSGDWFADSEAITEPFGGLGDLSELGDLGESSGLGDFLQNAGEFAGDVGDVYGGLQNIFGAGGPDVVIPQRTGVPTRQPGPGGMPIMSNGDGELMPVGVGGLAAAGGIWLGSVLARTFGRSAAGAVFQAANGVRVRLTQLWPLVRRYGPQAVAGALGVSLGGLGTLLTQAPTSGGRKRRRGISASDVKTTRRTIRTLKKLVRMSGIRMGGGGYRGGGGGGGYYRPRRRRHAHWH